MMQIRNRKIPEIQVKENAQGQLRTGLERWDPYPEEWMRCPPAPIPSQPPGWLLNPVKKGMNG
jgi:hypothetical protein